MKTVFVLLLVLTPFFYSFAEETPPPPATETTRWVVLEREHSVGETFRYVSAIYGLTWVGYYLHQREAIQDRGSLRNYTNNLTRNVVFDYDLPIYNWGIHVYTGSQAYLFYRAKSYSKVDAFFLSALQSALFEFTIETLTEPASIEDTINTPIWGTALGMGLEWSSLYLLNQDVFALRILGYILNPPAMLGLHEGEMKMMPVVDPKQNFSLRLEWEF